MKAHSEQIKSQALELLQQNRGPKEISTRLNISVGSIEDWASDWRKAGLLKSYKRAGMEFTNRAKQLSNGYYKSIRKRYLGMRWVDHLAKREFGFNNPVEAISYYLDGEGNPRVCAYCNRKPAEGKVWGLDRLDSSKGHVPGNLVPCCGFHEDGMPLSCQASKSNFSLFTWMQISMSRALGREATKEEVEQRLKPISDLAAKLSHNI